MEINNCFYSYKYNISITDKYIHITNYKNILNISSDSIIIVIYDKILNIYGKNLIVKKMDKYELFITGIFEKVLINEE